MRKECIIISKKHKATTLLIAMFIAFCVGAWLMASPAIEKQRNLKQQNELLDNISQSDVIIVRGESFVTDEVDFYDGDADVSKEEAIFPVNDATTHEVSSTEVLAALDIERTIELFSCVFSIFTS